MENKKSKINRMFVFSKEIVRKDKETVENYFEIGGMLKRIKEEKLYKYFGEHIEKFSDLFQEEEFAMSPRTAEYLIKISELDLQQVAKIGYTRTVRLLPYLEKGNDVLKNAIGLTADGFKDYLRTLKGQIPSDECSHKNKEKYELVRCVDCKKRLSFKKIDD